MKKIGRYEVVEELGRGAMGVVYKASDPTIGRLVALKVLSFAGPAEPGVPSPQEIFMREARAAGRLTHPAIVSIYDAFDDPETKSSCIVMELVEGQTLEKILLVGARFPLEKTLDLTKQVSEGLAYAHEHEVVHRDLKPANVLVSEDGHAKLTDFGIAKIVAREGALRTSTLMGTPSYMSPEQVTGGEIDTRSDLFSLGILLYMMLTGVKPFTGDTAAVMFKIVYEDPVAPSKLNTDLTAGHDYLALRLLAKDRGKRYATASEFLSDLDDVAHGQPPRSQARVPLSELATGERTVIAPKHLVPPPPEATAGPTKKSDRLMAGVAALAMLVILAGGGLWAYRRLRGGSQPAPSFPAAASPTAQNSAPPASTSVPVTPHSTAPGSATTSPSPATPSTSSAATNAASSSTPTAPVKKPATDPSASKALKPKPKPASTASASPPAQAPITNAAPVAAAPATIPATKPTEATGQIQLSCRHELKEGKLTLSADSKLLLETDLKGKKKGGFMGIKGSFGGLVSRSVDVPAGAHQLLVHVVTPDGTVDLSKSISATPPAGATSTLTVVAKRDALLLSWQMAQLAAPASPVPAKK